PQATRMRGGIGFAERSLKNGVTVLAYAVVNSVGDVREDSCIIAGARWKDVAFADCEQYLLTGHQDIETDATNTTLIAVFTNAQFSKIELKRISKVAISGMARAISPVFTRADGDIV